MSAPPAIRLAPATLVDACGAVSAIVYLWLARASHAPPVPLAPYLAAIALAWTALVALLWLSRDGGRVGSALPLGRVVAWAVVFRAIGLFAEPVLEDDFYRYLWDGYVYAQLGSPYGVAPMAYFSDPSVPLVFQRVLDGVNHPDLPTVYAPICQLLFLAAHWIAPGDLLPIKLGLVVADLATLLLLRPFVRPTGMLLYAWCPLLVQETAFSAHPDALGILFAIAAFAAARRGRHAWTASCAALAVGSKLFALLLVPFLLRRLPVRHVVLFALVLVLVHAPILLAGSGSELIGLSTFLVGWEFNSTLFAVLAMLLGPVAAKAIGLLVVGGVCAAMLWQERDTGDGRPAGLPRGDLLFGCLLLMAPVANPWYLLWLLPFVAARPSAWGVAALWAVSLSYVHGLFVAGLPPYHHPVWVRPAELTAIGIGVLLSARLGGRGSSPWRGFRRVELELRRREPIVSIRSVGQIAAAAALVVVVAPSLAGASGTYSGRPSHPPSSIDRASYELGKNVFAGNFVKSENAAARQSQAAILEELQGRLPLRARPGVELTAYAGQLDDEQLAALRYFLKKRYKVE